MMEQKEEFVIGDTVLIKISKFEKIKELSFFENFKEKEYFNCILWNINFDTYEEKYRTIVVTCKGLRYKALYMGVCSCQNIFLAKMVLIEKMNIDQQKTIHYMLDTILEFNLNSVINTNITINE